MKKHNFILSAFIFLAVLFTGCSNLFDSSLGMASDECSVTFSFSGNNARTALAEYTWNLFEYSLEIKAGDKIIHSVPKGSFSVVEKGRFPLPKKNTDGEYINYSFILKGYAAGTDTEVINGVVEKQLINDAEELEFVMYPSKGSTGNVRIIFIIPDVDVITNIRAARVTSRTYNEEDLEWDDLVITTGNNEFVAIYEKDGLPSGKKQYIVFEAYNSTNDLITRYFESVQVVGGIRANSTVRIDSSFYMLRSVSVSINKDNNSWTNSNLEIVAVNKDDPTKEYLLTDKGDGTFDGNLPEGTYEIVIKNPAGGSSDIHTGVDVSPDNISDSHQDIDFVTVEVPEKGVVLTPESGVASTDASGNLIVQSGQNFEVKVDFAPGYEADGTLNVGGTNVSKGETITLNSNNAALSDGIKAEGFKPTVYTITYKSVIKNQGHYLSDGEEPSNDIIVIDKDLIKADNEEKWFKEGWDGDNGTEGVVFEYTVEDYVELPVYNTKESGKRCNITNDGKGLAGWIREGDDTHSIVRDIKPGTTGDLIFVASWIDDKDKAAYRIEVWTEKPGTLVEDLNNRDNYTIEIFTFTSTIGEPAYINWNYTNPPEGYKVPEFKYDGEGHPVDLVETESSDGHGGNIYTNNIYVHRPAVSREEMVSVLIKWRLKDVTVTLDSGEGSWSNDVTSQTLTGRYGTALLESGDATSVIPQNAPDEQSTFTGWDEAGGKLPETFPKNDVTYTAQWQKTVASYTVEYWFEKVDSDQPNTYTETYYEQRPDLRPSDIYSGVKIGSTVTLRAESFKPEGFYRAKTDTAIVTEDNSAVVKVFYRRNDHTVSFALGSSATSGSWTNGANKTEINRSISGNYGLAISQDDYAVTANDGWEFVKWVNADTLAEAVIPSTIPDKDMSFIAVWNKTKANYTIDCYVDDVLNNSVIRDGQRTGFVPIGTTIVTRDNVSTLVNIPEGYTFVKVENPTVTADDAQRIKIYLSKKTITYTFKVNGGKWSDGKTTDKTVSGLYGANVGAIPTPVWGVNNSDGSPKFLFAGWKEIDSDTVTPSIVKFGAEDVTYVASWTPWVTGIGESTLNDVRMKTPVVNGTSVTLEVDSIPYGEISDWDIEWYDLKGGNKINIANGYKATVTLSSGKHTIILRVKEKESSVVATTNMEVVIQ